MILLHFISTAFINVKLYFCLHLFVLWVILFTSSFLSGFSKKKKRKKDCARMSVIAYALKHAI